MATIEPVVAAIVAYLVFGEYFTFLGYWGVALVILAVLLTIYEQQKSMRSAALKGQGEKK